MAVDFLKANPEGFQSASDLFVSPAKAYLFKVTPALTEFLQLYLFCQACLFHTGGCIKITKKKNLNLKSGKLVKSK